MVKKKKITLDGLAERVDTVIGLVQLTRSEMRGLATKEALNEVKEDVKYIKNMLDKETGFSKIMETEHPILVKRVVRIEDKLGLPHQITK